MPQAIQHYQRALQIDPTCKEAKVNLGVAFAAIDQNEQALEQYRETLELDPSYAVANFNMGLVLAKVGELDNAVRQFRMTQLVVVSVT